MVVHAGMLMELSLEPFWVKIPDGSFFMWESLSSEQHAVTFVSGLSCGED